MQASSNKGTRFIPDNPHIAQLCPLSPFATLNTTLIVKIKGNKIALFIAAGHGSNKVAYSTANLKLQRVVVFKDGIPVRSFG
jgi:hypothetical protein